MTDIYEYFATAPFEMEGIVAGELRSLGFENVSAQSGRAVFSGTLRDALYANLWLRTADRVLLHAGSFRATTFDELFDGTFALHWRKYLPKNAQFPVTAKCARSRLMSVPDSQSIVKKAVAESLKKAWNTAVLPESGPKYSINVHINGDVATLTLDTSGAGLTRRGYRTWNGEAPLRESMAASLISLCPWYADQPFCDPMCGSGTLAIEAAFIALDRAPGLKRVFDMESWAQTDSAMASLLRKEALDRFDPAKPCMIFAGDIDPKAVSITQRHIKQAGLEGKIKISCASFDRLRGLPDRGAFVLNPPYGMRLMDIKRAEELYCRLGAWYRAGYPYWSFTAITAYKEFERKFGKRADKKRRLFNGAVECGAFIYRGEKRPRP